MENKRGIKPKKEIKCCTMVNGSIDELIKEQGKLQEIQSIEQQAAWDFREEATKK